MIIDIHRHAVAKEWFSDRYWSGFGSTVLPALARMGMSAEMDAVLNSMFPLFYDTNGDKHIEQMDRAKIDKTVMLLLDFGLIAGEPEIPIQDQNKVVSQLAIRHPGRFIPFATIDPRRKTAADFVKKCVEEWGARGLKLHPGAGFNPEEKATLDLVEAVADFEIPVLVHTGPGVPPTSSRYGDPIYLDKMLLEFPEVKVIAAHLSAGYRQQLFSLAMVRPNLYTDIAGWQSVALSRYEEFAQAVRGAVDSFGAERVLFGTDYPYFWPVMPESNYVQAVRDLTTRPSEHARLTEIEVEMVLGGNANDLLKV